MHVLWDILWITVPRCVNNGGRKEKHHVHSTLQSLVGSRYNTVHYHITPYISMHTYIYICIPLSSKCALYTTKQRLNCETTRDILSILYAHLYHVFPRWPKFHIPLQTFVLWSFLSGMVYELSIMNIRVLEEVVLYLDYNTLPCHYDVIKWKHFPRYWTFVRGIHRSPVNSPHKSQWRGALMFSLICAWINCWVNNLEAGDMRRHRTHYDVIAMFISYTRPH